MFKKISIALFVIIVLISLNSGIIMAASTDTLYSGAYNNKIANAGALVAGWLRYGALVVAVIMLMVKGIKFMTASPDGKAEVKKEMIPWAIGLFVLFAFNLVIELFVDVGQTFNSNISAP